MKLSDAMAAATEKVFGAGADPDAEVSPAQMSAWREEVERLKAQPEPTQSEVTMDRATALRLQAQAEQEERDALEIVAADRIKREGWTFDLSELSTDDLRSIAEPKNAVEDDYEANKAAAESRIERGVTPQNSNDWNLNTNNEEN